MKPDVLLLHPTTPAQMERLQAEVTLHRIEDAPLDRITALIVNGGTPITEALLQKLPALQIICSSAAGYEKIDPYALTKRGVRLTTTSPALADDVADAALLLMLAARRDLVRAHAYVQSGEWARSGPYPLQSSVKGKRLGIAGFGAIGQALATRGRALGMKIGYLARSPKPVEGSYFASIHELAEWADVLALCLPGGEGTRGIVSAAVLQALGPQGTLVNVGRGSLVDEEALIQALRQGTIASAGLDVFATEPAVDPRLTTLPNVTLLPHHASGNVETREAMARLMVDNLLAHYAGLPLISEVAL